MSTLSILLIFAVALVPVLIFFLFAKFFAHQNRSDPSKLASVYHVCFLLALAVLFFVFSYNLYTTHAFSVQNAADYKLASDSKPARDALWQAISNRNNTVLCKQQDNYEWVIINPGSQNQVGFLIPLDKFIVLQRTN